MPETEYDWITKERLQSELRATSAHAHTPSVPALLESDLILLDCRSYHEFIESHIRSAVNFSIPSIMQRRLASGKIDLLATIKSPELKQRIQSNYKLSLFVLYNDVSMQQPQQQQQQQQQESVSTADMCTIGDGIGGRGLDLMSCGALRVGNGGSGCGGGSGGGCGVTADATINILYRRLKQDGCRVVALQDGFSSFRQTFPEWCEDDSTQSKEMESSRSTQTDQLMGLKSLRISTTHSDSACSSSAESSDCESTTHHNNNEAPVEIISGLFLGNSTHSCDSRALEKYNIKYVLNVTPDLPNVFETTSDIQYLKIPITDHYSQNVASYFPQAIQFIEEARSKNTGVLVHCLAGVSRSVTVTLAYLMQTRALSLNDAFTLVRNRKSDVSPNFHFMQQLHSFESKLRLGESGGGGDGGGGGGGIADGGGGGIISDSNIILNDNECTAMDESGSGSSGSGSGGTIIIGSGSGDSIMGLAPTATVNSVTSIGNSLLTIGGGRNCGSDLGSKFTCNCIVTDCKCMQTSGYMAQLAKAATGVSPDSGIEFDRWTPTSDTGLK